MISVLWIPKCVCIAVVDKPIWQAKPVFDRCYYWLFRWIRIHPSTNLHYPFTSPLRNKQQTICHRPWNIPSNGELWPNWGLPDFLFCVGKDLWWGSRGRWLSDVLINLKVQMFPKAMRPAVVKGHKPLTDGPCLLRLWSWALLKLRSLQRETQLHQCFTIWFTIQLSSCFMVYTF